jgi:hypothetical protein
MILPWRADSVVYGDFPDWCRLPFGARSCKDRAVLVAHGDDDILACRLIIPSPLRVEIRLRPGLVLVSSFVEKIYSASGPA